MSTRREFLAMTTVTLLAQVTGLRASIPARQPLDILVLGGTGFLGPHEIHYAIARGHRVTMFNRGSKAGYFGSRVEELQGNRDGKIDAGLSVLEGRRTWDVVIDNSGYVPRHVRDSAKLLKGRCRRYIYVSTVSVYDFVNAKVFPESAKLAELHDPSIEKVTGATYGPLKAECDRIVRDILGSAATVVRPTYVVGPGDHTDRFTYWVERVYRGGHVLAPSEPDVVAQWVDARDLCPWIVSLGENHTPGIYNAAGPASTVTRSGLMWGLRAMTENPVQFHWPSGKLLSELNIDLPMMSTGGGSLRFGNEASMKAGINYRSLADTARDTHTWWQKQSTQRRDNPRGWPSAETERKAIDRLKIG